MNSHRPAISATVNNTPQGDAAEDTPQDDSVNRHIDRIDNSYSIDKLGYASSIVFSSTIYLSVMTFI